MLINLKFVFNSNVWRSILHQLIYLLLFTYLPYRNYNHTTGSQPEGETEQFPPEIFKNMFIL